MKNSLAEDYDNRNVMKQVYDARKAAESAESVSADAVATANGAASSAASAVATANRAETTANGIDGKATQALTQSAEAVGTANRAEGTADAASAVADAAAVTANGIDAKAQNALDTAADAMTEASDASAKALAVDKKVDASNVRIGTLEISEGQQEALIGKNVNDIQYIKNEYLRKNALHETEEVTGRVDFKTNPMCKNIYSVDGLMDSLVNVATIVNEIAYTVPIEYYKGKAGFVDQNTQVFSVNSYREGTISPKNVKTQGLMFAFGSFKGSDIESVKQLARGCIVESGAFSECASLTTFDSSGLYRLKGGAFKDSPLFNKLIIRTSYKIVTLDNVNAFEGTGITPTSGEIFVPDVMVAEYKTATNWLVFADRIKGLSELPAEVTA